MYTVYQHLNKHNGKSYIGITSQKPEHRWRNGKGYKNMIFMNAINKYGWDSFDHLIIAENLTKDDAEKMEVMLISKLKTRDKNYGYNRAFGGGSNAKPTLATRKKIGSYHKGKTISNEHKRILSEYNSKENYDNWSEAKKEYYHNRKPTTLGYKFSDESKLKMRNARKKTPFISIDCNGETIEWNYLRECASELGLQHTNISRCLRGLAKQHKGYTFEYIN